MRISNIKSCFNQYNWRETGFSSHRNDWRKSESNSKSIALNILYLLYNTEKIRPAYISKHNLKRENQVILLMITDGKKWHYLVVKKLSVLFRGITFSNNGELYCLNCFYSFRTKSKYKKT